MHLYRKTIILAVAFLTPLFLTAQSVTIRGKITDQSGAPVHGAVIMIPELLNTYAEAAENGEYTISYPASESYTLKCSMLGYLSKEMSAPRKSGKLDIILEEDLIHMESVVVTGSRTPRLLKNAPILTRVITSKDIQRADAQNIRDILEAEIPGIEFTYAMDQQVTLNMQGFGGNSVLFLVDGERIAGETLDNIDYSRLNLDNVSRIEIIKGSASSLYGSNAVGGVVNIITDGAKDLWTVNLNGRYGTYNDQRYGGSVGFNAGKVNSVTHGQYSSIDSYEMPADGDFSTVYGGWNWSVKERLEYKPIESLSIIGKAGYFFRERNMHVDSYDRYRDFSAGLKGKYEINKTSSAELSYGFDQYDKSDYLLFNKTDIRDYSNVQHNIRGLYNATFAQKYTLTAGGDYMRDYLMSYQFVDNGYYIQHTADVFAQFEWDPNRHWNILAGLRYDFFSQKKMSHLSPKLGVMYKIDGWNFRGSYAGGFRAPTLKEMFMSFDMAGIFMIYGNENLKPEVSDNCSVSAEYIHKYFSASVTGFYNWVRNRITTAWNESLDGMVYTNMAPLQIRGADVNVSARFPFGLGARVSYTFTDEMIPKGEPMLSQTRPHSVTALLEYGRSWKDHGFNVALRGRVLSAVTTDVYTEANDYEETETRTYPGYTLWKLTSSFDLCKGIALNVVIDNLFNYKPDYYYSNSPATAGTTIALGLSMNIEKFFEK